MNLGASFRAKQLYDFERYEESLKEYAKAASEDPDDAHVVSMMALCELALGRNKQAIETANRAVSMSPEDASHHYSLALVYAGARDVKKAHKAIDRAIELDAQDAQYLAAKAAICAQGGDWRGAKTWSSNALQQDPDNELAQDYYAEALAYTGSRDEAMEVGAKALYDNPDSADAHTTNGFIYLRQGKHRDAAQHFREALRLEPNNERAVDGMKIALKATFPPYRWFVQAQLWLAGQGVAVRYAVIIAIIGIPRVLRNFASDSGTLAPYFYILAAPFTLFVWFTWFGDSLLNVLLKFHPLGKYLLKRHEHVESLFFIGLLSFAIAGLLLTSVIKTYGIDIAILCLLGLLLVGFSTNIVSNMKLRAVLVWTFGSITLAGAAIGAFVLLVSPPRVTP